METNSIAPPTGATPGGGNFIALRADYNPKLAVIVGSGPSLKGFDRSQLAKNWSYTIVINEEYRRAEGVFEPDIWIFNDPSYYKRLIRAAYEPYSDVQIVVSRTVWEQVFHYHKYSYQDPLWRNTAVYESRPCIWEPDRGVFLVRKTTATAALCLAHWMGFKHAAMLGVDMYATKDDYYYAGGERLGGRRPNRTVAPTGNGIYSDSQHMGMMTDFVKWKTIRDRRSTPLEVSQCSLMSPMTCFPRRTWAQAVAVPRISVPV